jgi:hypothetical protein
MRKTWVVKPIKEAKQFDYITTLMENILRYKKSKKPKKSKKACQKKIKILPQKRNQTKKQQSRLTLADYSQTNKHIFIINKL